MRLIDADALMEHIKKLECHAENKKYEQGLNDFLQCYLPQIIDNQPTAYNVDAVVEELKETNKIEVNAGMCTSGFIHCLTAIDIVKRGGVK